MWNDQKRERMQQLRQSELAGTLTDSEKSELSLLIQQLDDDEAALLRGATERLRSERQAIDRELSRVLSGSDVALGS